MFKWLFGDRKAATNEVVETVSAAPAQVSAPSAAEAPQELAVAVAAPVVAPASATPAEVAVSSPPQAEPAPMPARGVNASAVSESRLETLRSLSLLTKADDMQPTVGLDAIAIAPPRFDSAKVVRVQAGGRRVMVIVGDEKRARAYSQRPDGTYRLEGAPAGSPARLVLGASA